MNFLKVTDAELLAQTLLIAKEEQKFSFLLLEHLLEVDDRKLFATLGCDSLAKYVIKILGYAETTAYERVRAMRLLRRAPVLAEKLKTGAVNLSTAAQVEAFRQREKLSPAATLTLLDEVAHKSRNEVEIHLLSKTDNPIPVERVRQVTPELREAQIILDLETQVLLREYENIHGKQPIAEILKKLLRGELAVTTAAVKHRVAKPTRGRYVARVTRGLLKVRSQGQCEWRHPQTGVRCESRYRLQMDHYPKPYAKGGENSLENLRMACRAHNLRFAVEEDLAFLKAG